MPIQGACSADLESFAVTRDGKAIHAVDFNFWGVTFTRDANRFYATLGTGRSHSAGRGRRARRERSGSSPKTSSAPRCRPTKRTSRSRSGSARDSTPGGSRRSSTSRRRTCGYCPSPSTSTIKSNGWTMATSCTRSGHSVSATLRRADVWMLAIDGASSAVACSSPTPSLRRWCGRESTIYLMAKPPVVAELVWTDALRFDATSARIATVIDGDSTAGPSPVQMLVFGLAGCMAADVVDIVRKGRHPLTGFTRAHRCRARAGTSDARGPRGAPVSAPWRRAGGGRRAGDRAVA